MRIRADLAFTKWDVQVAAKPITTRCLQLCPHVPTHGRTCAQVRIRADLAFTKWDVEIAAPPTFSRIHKLAPLFGLIFRRSSCQHPVLAGALGESWAHSSPMHVPFLLFCCIQGVHGVADA